MIAQAIERSAPRTIPDMRLQAPLSLMAYDTGQELRENNAGILAVGP